MRRFYNIEEVTHSSPYEVKKILEFLGSQELADRLDEIYAAVLKDVAEDTKNPNDK